MSSITGVVTNISTTVRGNTATEAQWIKNSSPSSSLNGVVSSVAGGVRGNTAAEAQFLNSARKPTVAQTLAQAVAKIVDSFDAGPQAAASSREGQASQLRQIASGLRSGAITAPEAEKLLKQQKQISDFTKSAMADGKLTVGEYKQLTAMQKQASVGITLAGRNSDRTAPSVLGSGAHQAAQLERLASGRHTGNITNSELSKLLGQQVQIADARGDADTLKEALEVNSAQRDADKDIARHSKKGTQVSFAGVTFTLGNK